MGLDQDGRRPPERWITLEFPKARSPTRRRAIRRRHLQIIFLLVVAAGVLCYLVVRPTSLPWQKGSPTWWNHVTETSEWTKSTSGSAEDAFAGEVPTNHSPPIEVYDPSPNPPLPPLYGQYHKIEMALPQHNPDLPFPEGSNGKYLYIGNHQRSVGWGNVLQDMLLNHYLTFKSGRTYVFENYTWNQYGDDYSEYNGHLIPSRTPLTALMRGPTVGAPYLSAAGMPRSVKKEFFDEVCPEPVNMTHEAILGDDIYSASASTILERWLAALQSDERCITVPQYTWPIFDIYIFGEPDRLLPIWAEFSQSPMLQEFAYSPLVERAFDRNAHRITPSVHLHPLSAEPRAVLPARYTPIAGLLVLHVRRGDFAGHCDTLANYGSRFTAFNAFPGLPDAFEPPPEETRAELYVARCFPEVDQIVRKVQEVRASKAGEGLKGVYVMTNADAEWVERLKAALREEAGPWQGVASSRDLQLGWEEMYVKQAVDMIVGQRAQVFVGNGFSSLSGLIVMLRMASGVPADHNRHW